jgi:WD40 repeat protein
VVQVAVSPDGRWVASILQNTWSVKVWDARTGQLVKLLAEHGSRSVRFSPDGRWLAVGGDEGRLYAVGSWEPGLAFSGYPEFTSDGRLLAVAGDLGSIRLIAVESGRELVRLQDPTLQPVVWCRFTADGSRLIAPLLGDAPCVRVWDLRALRRGLEELGLDWDAPVYPPAPPPTVLPLRVEVRP